MNVALWVLQILLAMHTIMGAVWKFINSEQSVPSLGAIPHVAWLGLAVIELICAVGLVIPAMHRPMAGVAPIAALVIAVEMLLFCGVHLAAGAGFNGQVIYWLVVAAFAAFVAYGRFVLAPH